MHYWQICLWWRGHIKFPSAESTSMVFSLYNIQMMHAQSDWVVRINSDVQYDKFDILFWCYFIVYGIIGIIIEKYFSEYFLCPTVALFSKNNFFCLTKSILFPRKSIQPRCCSLISYPVLCHRVPDTDAGAHLAKLVHLPQPWTSVRSWLRVQNPQQP